MWFSTPTATSTGFVTATNVISCAGFGSDTCYNIYVRAVCSPDLSTWSSQPYLITTQIAPQHVVDF
jgi:hypothetical protein